MKRESDKFLLWVAVIALYGMAIYCVGTIAMRAQATAAERDALLQTIGKQRVILAGFLNPLPDPPLPDPAFLLWPIHPEDYKHISSFFGQRKSPIYGGEYRYHQASDIVGVPGARIRASAAGIVTDVYPPPGGKWAGHPTKGGYIEITHADGWITRYSHMSVIFDRFWVIGAEVASGEGLGRQGNTGLSIDDHLHFEVLKNGVHKNPLKYLLPPENIE